MLELRLCSSMERIFPESEPEAAEAQGCMLRNELYSFQIACRCDEGLTLTPELAGTIADFASIRQVIQVPSEVPAYPGADAFYERTEPGLFPDPLMDVPVCGVPITGQSGWRSFFVTVDGTEKPLSPGEHTLDVRFRDAGSGDEKARISYTLRVLPEYLAPQRARYTCWTYLDCIAQAHHVDLWSERFWMLTERYFRMARKYGVNMMLTPLLTPPLETAVGKYRMPVQLADIELKAGKWHFSFDKLDRFVEICDSADIETLEIAHLFSQWGARFAPQVIARVDGDEQRVFGWDTPADSPEYTDFLSQLLQAFRAHAVQQGFWHRCMFHISDEPGTGDREAYAHGKSLLTAALGNVPILDALSDFSLYSEGIVPIPVPAIDAIEPFAQAGVKPLWGYYCCAQTHLVSNRFFSMPLHRTRAMGLLMYVYDMQGFLHWGFNHYNGQQSQVRIDPFACTDAVRTFPSGDAFSVYPAEDGPAPSLRLSAFAEGLQDARLLRQAEEKRGRAWVMDTLSRLFPSKVTMTNFPRNAAFYETMRRMMLDAVCREDAP